MKRLALALLLAAAAGAAIYVYPSLETKKELKSQPSPPAVKAYSEGANMRGLNPIMVLVEQLPSAAAGCGISREAIRLAAELPLSQSPLQIVKSVASVKGYLYVQVNVITVQNTCVGNIYVSFRTGSVIEGNKQLTMASIWNENVIGAAWPKDAAGEINNAVETLTKKFIEEWMRDNSQKAVGRDSRVVSRGLFKT